MKRNLILTCRPYSSSVSSATFALIYHMIFWVYASLPQLSVGRSGLVVSACECV